MSYPLVEYTSTPTHATFTTRAPDGQLYPLTLPTPLYYDLTAPEGREKRGPYTLLLRQQLKGGVIARLTVDPCTAQGQAALIALGYAGPYPVPDGAMLGGYAHGTALTEREAMHLAGLPEFPEQWLICPSDSGGAPFTLLWGDAASNEQLRRSSDWATVTTAALQAEGSARGSA